MRHEIRLEGYALAVRPVAETDSEFILGLRSDPVLSRFLNPTTAEGHYRWLAGYFGRPGDYYFIIELLGSGNPEGTMGIYNVDETGGSAEWGRWVLRRGALFSAVESAWLSYRVAFEVLNLESVYTRTLRGNQRVISFHDSCGSVRNESSADAGPEMLEHRMTRADWQTAGPALSGKAAQASHLILRLPRQSPEREQR